MPPIDTTDDTLKLLISLGFLDAAGGLKLRNVQAKTGNYTVVTGTDPSFSAFTNRGAAGAVTFTLPAPSLAIKGTIYFFIGIADQNIVVAPPTVDTGVVINDAAADSLAMSTSSQKIGGVLCAVCDGTAWVLFGMSVGHTFTVAT